MKSLFLFLLTFIFLSLPGFAQEDDKFTPKKTSEISSQDELKELGYDSITIWALMDERVIRYLQNGLKSGGQDLPLETVKEIILEKAKGSAFHDFLKNNPAFLNGLADLMRNRRAISSFLGLFLRKDDIRTFGFIWLCFLVMGWLIKKMFFKPEWPKWKHALLSVSVTLLVVYLTMFTFYHVFEKELSPSVKIIQKHYHSSRT